MLELSIINRQDMELNAVTMIMADLMVKQTKGRVDYTSAIEIISKKLEFVAPEGITSRLNDYYNKGYRTLNMMNWTFMPYRKQEK